MIRRILALTIVVALAFSSPALAIQKKTKKQPKSSSGAKVEKQLKSPDGAPTKSRISQPPERTREKVSPVKERKKTIKKDRFIDNDDDGINDSMRKRQPVKVKKKSEKKQAKKKKGTR